MKKLFILGLIVALLLFSLPVLAEDGNGTVSGDVPQTNITTPAPTEVPTVEVTTVIPTDTPTPEVTTVPPTETPTPEVTTVAPTETPTPEVTTVEPTETPVVEVTTVEPTETPTPEVTTVEPTETPVVEVTTVEPTEIPTEVPTAEPTTVEPTVTETPPIVPPVVTPPAAVWTDKADYFFFEFVTIYGSGFTPDATVTVTLSTPDGVVSEWNTTSDSTGAFQTEYTTGLGQPDYIVTATDGTITASTAFTDATQTSTSLNPINGVDALNAGGSYPFSGTVSPNGIPSGSVILYYKIKGNGQCNTGAGGYTTAGTADLGSNGVFSNTFTAPSIVDTYCFFAEFQGYGGQNGFQKSSSATQIKDVISTNTPPNVAATNPSSSVNEGQTATNTGTWSDTNSGDTVTLSASVGTVTKFGTNAAGTWSWSYLTTDGPAQSQTVTITANDGNGGVTSATFSLTVNNVAPTATFNFPASVNEGSLITLTLTAPFDPSSVDTAAGFTYQYDFGSGYGTGNTFTPTDNGVVSVKGKITDKDGGFTEYTGSVTVLNVAPTASIVGAPVNSPEGTKISLTSTVSDPSSVDTAAGFTYAWSVTKDTVAYGSGGSGATFDFTPDDNAAYVVTFSTTDKDGGVGTDTKSITVDNVAPTLTISGDATVNEGALYTLELDSSDPGADTIDHWTITWGDGSLPETLSGDPASATHTYADGPNNYEISATATDEDGTYNAGNTVAVAVNNVAPTLTLSGAATVDEGSLYTLTLSSSDPGTDTIASWSINWGDGPAEVLTGNPASATHTYADGPNSYTIAATATDEDGTFNANTQAVTVNNVAPIVDAGVDATINEGSTFTSSGSFTDPGADTWTATVNYGDGSGVQTLALTGKTFALSHVYADNAATPYTVTVTVTDKDGGIGTDTAAVTVLNVVPDITVLTLSATTINENEETSLSGTFSDPGTLDTHTVEVNWGDGSTKTIFTLDANVLSFSSINHKYLDDNPTATPQDDYTITVKVTDKDSAIDTDTKTITVKNVAPTVGAVSIPLDPVKVGTPVSVLTTFTDPGTADTHTATWTWEDGTSAGTVTETGGSGSVSGTHTYTQPGIYTISAIVKDDDGGIGTSTVTTAYVVIYDPSGSFVTGGGWINSPAGAYTANPTMTGKANFGFVSKYKKGATVPDGETEFQFTAGNLNFHSSSYEWLVIANLKATYKGVGTINGAGKYGFILSAIDGDKKPDTFRIKIWEFNKGNNPEGMVYDNLINQPDDADPTTTLGGGSIVIHK